MTKDKITDEYIKAVQKQFKHYHAADTRFISDLKNAVISYAAQQDSLDYEQLVSQFGDPQELVNDYFSEQSIDKQKRSLRFSRNVKITCTIVILIVLGCTGIFFYTLNHLAQEEKNANKKFRKRSGAVKEENKTKREIDALYRHETHLRLYE